MKFVGEVFQRKHNFDVRAIFDNRSNNILVPGQFYVTEVFNNNWFGTFLTVVQELLG